VEKKMKKYIDTLKALSDMNRLRILLMLRVRPLCVCEISEVLNIALSTISSHLKILRNAGLIEDNKDGRWVIYRLAGGNEFFDEIMGVAAAHVEGDTQVIRDRRIVQKISREVCASKLKEKTKVEQG
jgi:ArsR family transcriptional regulator